MSVSAGIDFVQRINMKRKPLKIGDLTARIPVIQGGMGVGISLSHLAGSVAENGGVGILSAAQIGFREPDFEEHPKEANLRAIQSELAKARALAGGGIVGFNIMAAAKDYADYVKAAVKAGADLIISGAGLPEKLPEYVKDSNTKIAPIVSTEKAAKVMLRLWKRKYNVVPDLLVIEGPKAGGHLGFRREQLETFTDETYAQEVKKILTVVRETEAGSHKKIPVVLAGGIYDRSDMDAALAHIARYGSNHTEIICTNDHEHAMRFLREADASMVAVNASTRFNDGGQLGLGAEIGISTSKLHAYGPMGVQELTTTKFVVFGQGQVRQ